MNKTWSDVYFWFSFGYFGAMDNGTIYKGKHGIDYNQIWFFLWFRISFSESDMFDHATMLFYNFHDS